MTEWISMETDAGAAGRVRHGVLRRIRRRRVAGRAAAAAVAAALLSFVFWPRPGAVETLALRAPLPPAAPAVAVTAASTPRQVIPAPRGAEKITIFTSDPDVVIVLVSETGGEE